MEAASSIVSPEIVFETRTKKSGCSGAIPLSSLPKETKTKKRAAELPRTPEAAGARIAAPDALGIPLCNPRIGA